MSGVGSRGGTKGGGIRPATRAGQSKPSNHGCSSSDVRPSAPQPRRRVSHGCNRPTTASAWLGLGLELGLGLGFGFGFGSGLGLASGLADHVRRAPLGPALEQPSADGFPPCARRRRVSRHALLFGFGFGFGFGLGFGFRFGFGFGLGICVCVWGGTRT